MKIIIAGAGAVGTHLAKLFARERHDIVLMDDSAAKLEGLGSDFDLMTVCASPLSIAGLREAGAGRADLFIAVTPDEAHNMTSCMLARKLGARKTVARVDNEENTTEENRAFFRSVGIDSIIYPEMLAGARSWLPSAAAGRGSGGKCTTACLSCWVSRCVGERPSSTYRSKRSAALTRLTT